MKITQTPTAVIKDACSKAKRDLNQVVDLVKGGIDHLLDSDIGAVRENLVEAKKILRRYDEPRSKTLQKRLSAIAKDIQRASKKSERYEIARRLSRNTMSAADFAHAYDSKYCRTFRGPYKKSKPISMKDLARAIFGPSKRK